MSRNGRDPPIVLHYNARCPDLRATGQADGEACEL